MKNSRRTRVFSLLLCCLMLVGLLPLGQVAYAADDRIVISEIEATSNISSIAVNGGAIQAPSFTVSKGAPARINPNSGNWWKKNGETWEIVKSGSFTPGTWRYKVQVRIDAADGSDYVLASPPTVKVDGAVWSIPGTTMITSTVSYTDAQSPEIIIADSGELTFTGLLSYNIPDNHVGTPISSYNVSTSVSGGTPPYVFSKTSGPDWITVKVDGTVSGTPTTPGSNSNMFIRVTDSVGNWKEINVSVGNTLAADKIIISEIEARSNISELAVSGKPIQTVSFALDKGSPAFFNASSANWWKKNGETWEIIKTGNFTPGTWRYTVQLRINADDGLIYQLAAPPTVKVDGVAWSVPGTTMIMDKVSYTDVQSPEIMVSESVQHNVTFNANGHGTAPAAQSVEDGKTATKPTDPTASGWIFRGWYTEAACTNAFDFSTPITGNITLYAKWTQLFNVTFDMRGHGTAPTYQTVESGNTAAKPDDPSEDGWIFRGWYTEAACTNAFDFSTPITSNIVLYAKWTERVNTHGIIFDNGGGTGTKDSEIGIHMATYICPPADTFGPPSADKEFDQWEVAIGKAEPQRMDPGESFYLFGDTTIKALWKDKSTTAFAFTTQPVGGSAKKSESYTFSWETSDTPDTIFLDIWLPTASDWGTSIPLTGLTSYSETYKALFVDGNISKYRIRATKGSDTIYSDEFTVTWTDEAVTTYTVTFDANGHGTAPAAQSVESGKTATKPADPTASGWSFGGWFKEAACTNAFDFTTPITANITLYAKWTEDSVLPGTYTVKFDANGHGTAPDMQEIESGKTATKPADPTATGWIFGGWYREAACTNAFDFTTPITADITLYAKWTKDGGGGETPITYTVTFDANGHGTAPSSQTVESGKTATKPADPTASGWTFKGWYKEADCINAFDFSTPITGNITLYAKWTEDGGTVTPDTYTVTFDANGHGTAPAAQTIEDGKTATKPTDPTASGWTFKGWYKEADCINAFDFATPITGNVTLYAKWTENSGGQDVSPQTGDNSHLGLWIALMAVSLIGLGGVTVFRKDRKRRYKHSSAR